MQEFTVKDIENLTGIKSHTLRTWEQQYSLFVPKRKASSYRIYDNDGLKQLLRISFLYHNGWKVSKIAAMDAEEILKTIRSIEITHGTYKTFIAQLIEAAVDFNEPAFVHLLEQLFIKIGFENCIVHVCYPFLDRIGLLWAKDNIMPAREHFSSYIIRNKIIAETNKLPLKTASPEVILFSPHGKTNELPLLFIHYLLKKNGWGVVCLGSDIAKDALKELSRNKSVQCLFIHHATNITGWDADIYFEDLCRRFLDKTIIVSGTVVHQIQRSFVNMKLLKNDKEIYDFIERRN